MPIVTIGIDLAKSVFAVHGVDEAGKAVLIKPRVSREQLGMFIAQLPPCVIGMEACSGAHYWARVFQRSGHTAKLMAPKLVAPYRMSGKRGKNDAADAAAICEAVTRPSMRFVPIKDEHQQATICLHRTRQGFVEERTATYNRLRGMLTEFGVVLPQSPERLRQHIPKHLDALPNWVQCQPRPAPWSQALVPPMNFRMADRSQLGSGSRLGNTVVAAKPGWAVS